MIRIILPTSLPSRFSSLMIWKAVGRASPGPWAYDEVKAKKLWEVSLKSVGLEDEA